MLMKVLSANAATSTSAEKISGQTKIFRQFENKH